MLIWKNRYDEERVLMVLDEVTSNRLVSVAAILILIITALFIFATNQTNLQVTRTESGWIMTSTSGRTETSLDHLDCKYIVSHDLVSNTTAISGIVAKAFNASRESTNLTFSMNVFVVAIWNACSVEVNKKAALTCEQSITLYESSDYYPTAFFAFEEHRMQGTSSFNDTIPKQYVFTMEWNMSLAFSNVTVFDARYYYNISFYLTIPDLVQVVIPSTYAYNALVVATVGVVIISMAIRTWNHPRVIDDSEP
jgi:hypothetical protein